MNCESISHLEISSSISNLIWERSGKEKSSTITAYTNPTLICFKLASIAILLVTHGNKSKLYSMRVLDISQLIQNTD